MLERRPQRPLGRVGGLRPRLVVGATLDQLDVVVAEPPEERLGALERAGVVELLERLGRLGDDGVELGEHRPVDRVGHPVIEGTVVGGRAELQHELGDVEQLVGQLAADLHLVLAEGGVDAGAARTRPVAHGVGAVAARTGPAA